MSTIKTFLIRKIEEAQILRRDCQNTGDSNGANYWSAKQEGYLDVLYELNKAEEEN